MRISVFFLLLLVAGVPLPSFALGGAAIVQKADRMRYIDGDVSFFVEVTDHRGSNVQKSKYKVFSKGSLMSRVETILPERQFGRKMLMKDNDLWFYSPDIKRATRISMQQRLTGEVANGDLARTNFGGDYSAEVKGEEVIDNVKTIHLSLKKLKDDVTYSGVEYWVSANGYMPIKAIFKSDSGKNLKVATYSNPKPVLGQKLISKIEIVNAFNKNQKSILIFTGYRKEKLSESFFNKESLNN